MEATRYQSLAPMAKSGLRRQDFERTYERLLLEHHHRQNRPYTFQNCRYRISAHALKARYCECGNYSCWLIEQGVIVGSCDGGEQSFTMVESIKMDIPIVNDESGNFFYRENSN